ncbi:hypothetical protein J6590_075196 [Homalodisca vitripennis]|nr:hypothetical protein J6590_075196 [Homalodisca vitripennis]
MTRHDWKFVLRYRLQEDVSNEVGSCDRYVTPVQTNQQQSQHTSVIQFASCCIKWRNIVSSSKLVTATKWALVTDMSHQYRLINRRSNTHQSFNLHPAALSGVI